MKLDRNKYLESRSLKPSTLLVAIICVNLVLGIIVWLFPRDGISLGQDSKLKFVSFEELQGHNDTIASINIDEVLEGVSPLEDTARSVVEIGKKDTPIQKNITVDQVRSIQMPPNNPDALRMLLHALHYEANDKVIRILHYGDSQLEGDRISDYFRNRMQSRFGGNGPGIVLPLEPAASSRRSVYVSESKSFRKSAIYKKGSVVSGGMYGIGGATYSISGGHSRFVKWQETPATDSTDRSRKVLYSSDKQSNAELAIKNGSSAMPLAKTYSRTTLLYSNNQPFQVRLRCDNFVDEYTLNAQKKLGVKTWNVGAKKRLRLTFSKGKFPNIYGVALDGEKGVAVDNFAMRGSSAIGFSKMDNTLYTRQMKALNVRAVILQYGINVVPNVRSDYAYYKKILVAQLNSIKAANPGVSIIVIGPSDMSRNRGGRKVSYPNIPLVRDAMKEAAFETGCCFWDLYEAMGGENSMSAWVNKGLAQKDYTHFSYKGAKYVGEMLYAAIMEQLDKEQ